MAWWRRLRRRWQARRLLLCGDGKRDGDSSSSFAATASAVAAVMTTATPPPSTRSSSSQAMFQRHGYIERWLQEAALTTGAPSSSSPPRVLPVLRIQLLRGNNEKDEEAWDIVLPSELDDMVVPFVTVSTSDLRAALRKQMLEVLAVKQDGWRGLCHIVETLLEDNRPSNRVTILTAFADIIFAMLVLASLPPLPANHR